MSRRFILAFVAAGACFAPGNRADGADARRLLTKPIRVDWRNTRIVDALNEVSRASGLAVVVDPSAQSACARATVMMRGEDTPVIEVVQYLADAAEARCRFEADRVLVLAGRADDRTAAASPTGEASRPQPLMLEDVTLWAAINELARTYRVCVSIAEPLRVRQATIHMTGPRTLEEALHELANQAGARPVRRFGVIELTVGGSAADVVESKPASTPPTEPRESTPAAAVASQQTPQDAADAVRPAPTAADAEKSAAASDPAASSLPVANAAKEGAAGRIRLDGATLDLAGLARELSARNGRDFAAPAELSDRGLGTVWCDGPAEDVWAAAVLWARERD